MYEPRTYRNFYNTERFTPFTVQFRDTDLWIGVDRQSFVPEMALFARNETVKLRHELENYLLTDPWFGRTLEPVEPKPGAPRSAWLLADAGARSATGPMAAVAGLFAWHVGEKIRQNFSVKELVIENGGDMYLLLQNDLAVTVFAGSSPLSEKMAVVVPAGTTPCGVCTSSGTVGHSFSFGKADAVMVACQSPLMADALATALANRVKSPADVQDVLTFSEEYPEIESLVVICRDKLGIRGSFAVKFVQAAAKTKSSEEDD